MAAGQTAAPLSNASPMLQELGKQVQDASLPEAERVALIKVLAEWGTGQVREPLMAVLTDPSASVREWAARALGWPGNREAVGALRARIEAAGEIPAVRAAALEALGRIGDDSVREAVLAATTDPDARVRGAALAAVTSGLLARPSDRAALLRRVAEDRALNLLMRCEAIAELGAARDTASAPLLMRLLENEPPIPMALPRPGATQQEMLAVRYREARDVRAWAAKALGALDARESLPMLLKSAEDPDDFFLRFTAVEALVAWHVPEAVPVLLRRLGDSFADTRVLALAGLAKAGDRRVGEAVVGRLGDPVPAVRLRAVMTLFELGDPRARGEFEKLRKRETDANVQQALEAALALLPR